MSTPHTPQTPNPYGTPGQPEPYGRPGPQPGAAEPGVHPAPAQPAAGTRYGTVPYEAGPYGTGVAGPSAFGADVPEPPQHRRLLKLTLASGLVYLLSMLPGLLDQGEVRRQVEEQLRQSPGMTEEGIQRIIDMAPVFMVGGVLVGALLGIVLYALVYLNLRGAKNWARVLGIVLAIIGIVTTLPSVFAVLGGSALSVVTGLLALLFVVVNALWLAAAFHRDEVAYTRQGRRVAP